MIGRPRTILDLVPAVRQTSSCVAAVSLLNGLRIPIPRVNFGGCCELGDP